MRHVLPRLFAVALAAAVIVPTVAIAGDTAADVGGKRGKRGKGKMNPAEREALRERVQSKIQSYLTVELSSRAGLDDKKSLQLGNTIKAHLERRESARGTRHEAMKKLRELVDSKASDAALKTQMAAVASAAKAEDPLDDLMAELGKFLTTQEQAKVMVAFPEVMKDAMHLIRDARRGGRGGGGPGPGGCFGGEPDDE